MDGALNSGRHIDTAQHSAAGSAAHTAAGSLNTPLFQHRQQLLYHLGLHISGLGRVGTLQNFIFDTYVAALPELSRYLFYFLYYIIQIDLRQYPHIKAEFILPRYYVGASDITPALGRFKSRIGRIVDIVYFVKGRF